MNISLAILFLCAIKCVVASKRKAMEPSEDIPVPVQVSKRTRPKHEGIMEEFADTLKSRDDEPMGETAEGSDEDEGSQGDLSQYSYDPRVKEFMGALKKRNVDRMKKISEECDAGLQFELARHLTMMGEEVLAELIVEAVDSRRWILNALRRVEYLLPAPVDDLLVRAFVKVINDDDKEGDCLEKAHNLLRYFDGYVPPQPFEYFVNLGTPRIIELYKSTTDLSVLRWVDEIISSRSDSFPRSIMVEFKSHRRFLRSLNEMDFEQDPEKFFASFEKVSYIASESSIYDYVEKRFIKEKGTPNISPFVDALRAKTSHPEWVGDAIKIAFRFSIEYDLKASFAKDHFDDESVLSCHYALGLNGLFHPNGFGNEIFDWFLDRADHQDLQWLINDRRYSIPEAIQQTAIELLETSPSLEPRRGVRRRMREVQEIIKGLYILPTVLINIVIEHYYYPVK